MSFFVQVIKRISQPVSKSFFCNKSYQLQTSCYHSQLLWASEPDSEVKLQIGVSGRAALPPITISKLFKDCCSKHGPSNALHVKRGGKWRSHTYSEFYEESIGVAKSLLAAGMNRFDGVSIMGSNSPEWMMADIGAILAGGVAVGIYTTNSLDITQYILEHSNSRFAFGENNSLLEKLLEAGRTIKGLKVIQSVSGPVDLSLRERGVISWDEFLELGKNIETSQVEAIMDSQRPGQCSTLLYTSGTTGIPKGVMMSHDNLVWNSYAIYKDFNASKDYRMLSYLPFCHIAAQVVDMMIPLHSGCKVFFGLPDAIKGSIMDTLQEVEPDLFLGVPRVWEKLKERVEPDLLAGVTFLFSLFNVFDPNPGTTGTKAPSSHSAITVDSIKKKLGFANAKICLTTASPICLSVLEFFHQAGITIYSIYGTSENTGPGTMSVPGANVFGSLGRSFEGGEVKIHNPDSKGEGEVCFRGRYNFMGYLHEPEKTASVTDKDGWYYTGDIGRMDEQGFLYLAGRMKEILITSGGENVAPVPIEQKMKKHLRLCSYCVVVGGGRKYLNMLVTLKSKLDDQGVPIDELNEEAIGICRDLGLEVKTVSEAMQSSAVLEYIQEGVDKANQTAISSAATIKKFTILPRDFSIPTGEVTPTAKLKRGLVIETYAKVIDQFYQ